MPEYIERFETIAEIQVAGKIGKQSCMDIVRRRPAADVVSRDAFDRILAENDDMRAQLAEIGKKPGDDMSDVRRMERMEFGYNHGFTCALLKVKEQLDTNLAKDMKRHKMRFTANNIEQAIDCMIENRELLRDNPQAFLRCKQGGGFEVVIGR